MACKLRKYTIHIQLPDDQFRRLAQSIKKQYKSKTQSKKYTYERGGEAFWVDARVNWPSTSCTLTVENEAEPQADYDVQAYLVHRHDAGVPVSRGMCSGHSVAYFKHGGTWYLADDAKVTMLALSLIHI